MRWLTKRPVRLIRTSSPSSAPPPKPRRTFPPHLSAQEPFQPSSPCGFFTSTSSMTFRTRNPRYLTSVSKLSRAAKREERFLRFDAKYQKEVADVAKAGIDGRLDPLMEGAKRSAGTTMLREALGAQDAEPTTTGRRPPTTVRKSTMVVPRFSRGVLMGDQFRVSSISSPSSPFRFYTTSTRPTVSSFLSPSLNRTTFVNSRPFSIIAQNRATELANKIPAETEIDLKQIMDDLRDLELLDMLRKVAPKGSSSLFFLPFPPSRADLSSSPAPPTLSSPSVLPNIAAVGFKDATRALYPLFHQLDQGQISRVTFAQLQDALPPHFTVPWTHIAERLLYKRNSKLDALKPIQKAQVLFLQIYSIGPTRAFNYANAGCRTLEDLEKRSEKEKLKLTKAQKIGLKHREVCLFSPSSTIFLLRPSPVSSIPLPLLTRLTILLLQDIGRLIPRSEMEKLRSSILSALKAIDPAFECEILGSYRRGIPFSSDLDVALRHPSFVEKDDEATAKPLMRSVVAHLEKQGLLEEEHALMLGAKKYAVRLAFSPSLFSFSLLSSLRFPLAVTSLPSNRSLTQSSSRIGPHPPPRPPSLPPNRHSSLPSPFLPLHASRFDRRFAPHEATSAHGEDEGIVSE
jgi:hypothetical protein